MPVEVAFARLLKIGRQLDRLSEVLRCRKHTHQWLRLTADYVGLMGDLPFDVKLSSGRFEFLERSDVATFWQIFYREIYPVEPSDLLIMDAGANIGAFSLYALQTAPQCKVIAVEPAPDSCKRFRSMLCANAMESRCTLYEAALGERPGDTRIRLDIASQFRRTGISGYPVQTLTLDSLIPLGATVDLLKMDIEGAEYSVLNSLSPDTLRRIRRIDLEFHPQAPAVTTIGPLISNGFMLKRYHDEGEGYAVALLARG
jgi:FkbM family methyltransferase